MKLNYSRPTDKRIADALRFLTALIDAGTEYPDAEWRAVEEFNLCETGQQKLMAAYDAVGNGVQS